jgi:hypothetical protein
MRQKRQENLLLLGQLFGLLWVPHLHLLRLLL